MLTRRIVPGLVLLALLAGLLAAWRPSVAQAAPAFSVATADSMDLSYPRTPMPCACGSGTRVLDLTRGEREDTQVVALAGGAVTGLRARVASVTGPDPAAVQATIAPLGFLNVTPTTAYKNAHMYAGWIPDPIRTDLTQVNVPAGARQPFWLEIAAGPQAPAGSYQVTVELTDATGATLQQVVEARVWPVAIRDRNELATTLTTHPDVSANNVYDLTDHDAIRAHVRKTFDFLTSYRIEPDNIYASKIVYSPTATGPDPDDLLYLQQKGWLNRFSAYYLRPDLPAGLNLNDETTWPAAINARMSQLTANLTVYSQRGLASKAYVYGFDELNTAPGRKFAKQMFDRIKQTYPNLPIMTTLFDASMGQTTGLTSVDWWSPELFRYPRAGKQYAQSQGDKVFWYPAIASGSPYPNWFNGYPPMDARMLMGVMSNAEGIDGVLYYNIDRWYSPGPDNTTIPKDPMTDGIYSTWDPRTFRTTAGDGSLYYPGATGPLGSQRLANVRDGLEDYNLLQELRRRSTAAGADPALRARADRLLAPKHLADASNVHSRVSGALRRHRVEVLDLITAFDGSTSLAPRPRRILPIGSSTMDGNTAEPAGGPAVNAGARPDLYQLLEADGPVDLVGPSYDANQVHGDREHAGIDGDLAAFRANIDAWMATYAPDDVLLHAGAREVLSETYDLTRLATDLGAMVDRIFTLDPGVRVHLATVGPISQDGQDDINRTNAANTAIAEVVRTRQEAGKPIRLLDNRARILGTDANGDKIHLNASGYSKAASGWYGGMAGLTPVRLEAELGTRGGLAAVLSTYYASGQRKVGKLDDAASFVQVVFNAPHQGRYRVAIRGGNGTLQPSSHSLSVNGGAARTVTYEPYGWEKWTLTALDLDLSAGRNTLRLTKQGGYAEVDFVEVMVPTGVRHGNGPAFYTRDALDRPAYLARRTDGALSYGRLGATWSDSSLTPPAPIAGTPSVALDADGRLGYFARSTDGRIVHGLQQTAGSWQASVLTPAEPIAGDPVATLDRSGELVYVARTSAGRLVYGRDDATAVLTDPSGVPLVTAGEPSVALTKNGALALAARTAAGTLLYAEQTVPGSATFATATIGAPSLAGRPALGTDANGTMTFVARRTDGKLAHGWGFGTDASTWTSIVLEPRTDTGTVETVSVAGDPVVAQDHAGKLTYTVRTTDRRILHGWQHAPATGPWHATVLPVVSGSPVDGDPQLVLDGTGRLTYVARSAERLLSGRQDTPGLAPWHTSLIGGGLAG